MLGGGCEILGDWDRVGPFCMSAYFPATLVATTTAIVYLLFGFGAITQTASTCATIPLVCFDLHRLPMYSLCMVPESTLVSGPRREMGRSRPGALTGPGSLVRAGITWSVVQTPVVTAVPGSIHCR